MMLAPTIAKLLKQNAHDLNLNSDYIFPYFINEDVQNKTVDASVIKITEISDNPNNYGSNSIITKDANVQIQVFFPPQFSDDTSVVIDKIIHLLLEHNWFCTQNNGILHDPDTNQLYNTCHFRKNYND